MQIVTSGRSAHSKLNWMDFCFQTNRQLRFHQHVHQVSPHVLTSCAPQFQRGMKLKPTKTKHAISSIFDTELLFLFFTSV